MIAARRLWAAASRHYVVSRSFGTGGDGVGHRLELGKPPMAANTAMEQRVHGTCVCEPAKELRWGVDAKQAERESR